ncbi:MAG: DEAD/DEAH box helicase [bacterium]
MMQETKQKPGDFYGLGITPRILEILEQLKFNVPTPIQLKSIPVTIEGKDIVGIAQTGTGKTLAFGIPLMQRLAQNHGRGLILLPTRELAIQVDEHLRVIGNKLNIKTTVLIGGESISKQLQALRQRPQVIIATPGRTIDLLKRNAFNLKEVKILILDEADLMFDMGFAPQIQEILKQVPKERQTMLFSATMDPRVMQIATKYMALPIRIEVAPAGTAAEKVDHEMIILRREDKLNQLKKILSDYPGSILIFVRTKHGVKDLCRQIRLNNHQVAEIHSNRSLAQRREALGGFKKGRFRILVATDIAARGIDVKGIELVLNYDLPDNLDDYVHRIGRTGRAGKTGKAISFALPNQMNDVKRIGQLVKKNIPLTQIAKPQYEQGGYKGRGNKFQSDFHRNRQFKRGDHRKKYPYNQPKTEGNSSEAKPFKKHWPNNNRPKRNPRRPARTSGYYKR